MAADRAVRHNVGRDLSIAQSSKAESSNGNQESCAISCHWLIGISGKEHDIANHDQRRRSHEEVQTLVELAAQQGEQDCEESSDDIRRNSVQLLGDDASVGVDSLDDGRCKEGEALHSDVVEQEDP